MASSPMAGERPMMQGLRRSSAQAYRRPSLHERAGLEKADANAEVLYSHPSARVVRFSPPKESIKSKITALVPPDTDYPIDTVETLPWRARTEVPIASGALVLEKVRGSTNFLKCQEVTHAILRNSQCWCVDGESKFVLRVRKFEYYRIELPSTTDEDKKKVEELKTVFPTLLRYERTPCPFIRAFQVDLPDDAITPRRKGTWKRRDSSQSFTPEPDDGPVRPTNSGRKWSMKSPPTAYPKNGPMATDTNVLDTPGTPTSVYQRSPLHRRQSDLEDHDDGQSDLAESRPESEPGSDAELSDDGSVVGQSCGRPLAGKQPDARSLSVSARVAAFETVRVISRVGSFRQNESVPSKRIPTTASNQEESLVALIGPLKLDLPTDVNEHILTNTSAESLQPGLNDDRLPPKESVDNGLKDLAEDTSEMITIPKSSTVEGSETANASQPVLELTERIEIDDPTITPAHDPGADPAHASQSLGPASTSDIDILEPIPAKLPEEAEIDNPIQLLSHERAPPPDTVLNRSPEGYNSDSDSISRNGNSFVLGQDETSAQVEGLPEADVAEDMPIPGTQSFASLAQMDNEKEDDNLSTVSSTDSFHTMTSIVPQFSSNNDTELDDAARAGHSEDASLVFGQDKRTMSLNTATISNVDEIVDESDLATPLYQRPGQQHDGIDSAALDQALLESNTREMKATDDGIRQRLSVRRTLSPPPPVSTIVSSHHSRSGANHDLVKSILQHAITKPVEVVVLLIHVLSRIAAGATVNDLLSGELFRRPERRDRVSGFADHTDRSASHDTEDDYGVPIRGRTERHEGSEHAESRLSQSPELPNNKGDSSRSSASVD